MKWAIRIALLLSLIANGYFVFDEIRHQRIQEFGKALNREMGVEVNKTTTWKPGFELFTARLKEKNKALPNKKYYYINIWIDWCKPCIREMPWLDSLAGTTNKDIGYFFVSEMSDGRSDSSLNRRNFNLKNFVFLNEMDDFVSAICNKVGRKSKAYPMAAILNSKGELLHFSIGAYSNRNEAIAFTELINKLD